MHDLTQHVSILLDSLVGELVSDFDFAPLVERIVGMIVDECQRVVLDGIDPAA